MSVALNALGISGAVLAKEQSDLKQKQHVVITGTNRGIGLALTCHYATRGHTVFATCRQVSEDLKKVSENVKVSGEIRIIDGVDVSRKESFSRLHDQIDRIDQINILILNAGNYEEDTLDTVSPDAMRKHFDTHVVGALNTIQACLPKMREGGKIIVISSRMGSMASNLATSSGEDYAYRAAKGALNSFAVTASIDLKRRGITVLIVHPGLVETSMQLPGTPGLITPEQSAESIGKRIDAADLKQSGQFLDAETGEVIPF